ncbi:tetratricopeptide repeat protein [Herpetosiphon gulosus]|uniref:Tetratricopeptide repeat protein n=1 Tax=Herpetosiphon gulosus TaxID=1973496 RepID=A0ABP9X4D0_9CHLR
MPLLPSQLPQYATRLIGRTRARTLVIDLLLDAQARLVTLYGQSGAGKTRLSLEVAEQVGEIFRDGRYFVALAPVSQAQFVLPTIAATLGVEESQHEAILDSLVLALADKQILLILDNFEQVAGAASELLELLQRAPGVTCLVTSQQALEVAGETAIMVPALQYPEVGEDYQLEDLEQHSAIGLFVDRMRTRQPRFRLSADNAGALVDICRLVQGLPLAIELIAAHSASLTPQDLLFFVRNHLSMAALNPKQSARQAIIKPVLTWSVSMLPADAKDIFAQLGVFAGGATVETIKQVGLVETMPFESSLNALIDRHLLQTEQLPGQKPRFIMIDAVREYALEQLQKTGRLYYLQERHAIYYQGLSETVHQNIRGADGAKWIEQLRGEIHNIRQAMVWSLESSDGLIAQRIAGNLYFYWYRTSAYREAVAWLEQTYQHSNRSDLSAIARIATGLGGLLISLIRFSEAEYYLIEARRLWQELGLPHDEISAIGNLAVLYGTLGRLHDSQLAFEAALALARKVGNQQREVLMLHNLGTVAQERNQLATAQAYFEQALALKQQINQTWDMFLTQINLGLVAVDQGRYAEAEQWFEQAFINAYAIGDHDSLAYIRYARGIAAVEQADYAQAELHFHESERGWRAVGNPEGVQRSWLEQVAVLITIADYIQASEYLQKLEPIEELSQELQLRYTILATRLAIAIDDQVAMQSYGQRMLATALASELRRFDLTILQHSAAVLVSTQPTLAAQLLATAEQIRVVRGLHQSVAEQQWLAQTNLLQLVPTAALDLTTALQAAQAELAAK